MNADRLALRDGARVRVRPIAPDDRERLSAAFEHLSAQSRYQRFFSPVHELSEGTLDYLTQIDHHDHEALVAVDEETDALVGVARYVVVEDGIAEPAITIVDDWQGRGLSGELLRRLVVRALDEDIGRFRAYVLRENPHAIAAMRRLGETTSSPQGTALQLDIELDEPEQVERTARDLLRAAAEGALQPPLTLWRRIGSVVRIWNEGRTEPWEGELGDAIVVGADGSDGAGAAMRTAIALATGLGVPLHVVAAYRPWLDSRTRADELLRCIEEHLRPCSVEPEVHLRQGDAAEALIGVAEQTRARTIVVGASGTGRRGRHLVGSVADKVARHAPCNVLVARGR